MSLKHYLNGNYVADDYNDKKWWSFSKQKGFTIKIYDKENTFQIKQNVNKYVRHVFNFKLVWKKAFNQS